MEKFKDNDNLLQYVENYFSTREDYELRPNHRAPIDPILREKMKETPLVERLNWVLMSERKKRYEDPFQSSLFDTFDKEELAQFLITYDPKDKKKYVDARMFEKMPRGTMQSLFLYEEAMDNINDYGDKTMLAKEYSKENATSIYDFMINNADSLDDDLFVALKNNLPTTKQLENIEDIYEDFFVAYYEEKSGRKR